MAVRDLEAFVRERASVFDPNLDLNPGSPFDKEVIQPIVRRTGTDPFSVDLLTFVHDRLNQAFPNLANDEADVIPDIINKPVTLLWDPIVREVRRVQQGLSFRDPSVLTLEEAEALAANLFTDLRQGRKSKGVGRIFFSQAQNQSVSPVNYVTSRGGLHFFPITIQSIRTEEMIFNVTSDGLYYFDVNLVAEEEGVQYNIEPNSLVSISNVQAAVRVTNLRRFDEGDSGDTAQTLADRAQQELTERSMVTLRGVSAKISESFPEVSRLNVVGFGDPEMQRDIIKGGGLGTIIAQGSQGASISDGLAGAQTKRFSTTEVNFNLLVVSGTYILTIVSDQTYAGAQIAEDFEIESVVTNNSVDFTEQGLLVGKSDLFWTLRKKELTLSEIPGGILFPDNEDGTVGVPSDEVHIGGAYDIYIRASSFEESTLTIDVVTDSEPELRGTQLEFVGYQSLVRLKEYTLDTNYVEGDEIYTLLNKAEEEGYTLQIVNGNDAGSYRVTEVQQVPGSSPVVRLAATLTNPPGDYRWRLIQDVHVNLIDPKEERVAGIDMSTVQGSNIVTTTSSIDFDEFGVAQGDVLRILTGPDASDYTVDAAPLAPGSSNLQLNRGMTSTQSNIEYVIYRANAAGGLELPLVRVKSVEMLDTSGQPVGTVIPYAKPIDIQSRAFQNPARGVKHEVGDGRLGVVSLPEPIGGYVIPAGGKFRLASSAVPSPGYVDVVLTGGAGVSRATVISEINAAMSGIEANTAVEIGPDRFGIRPLGTGGVSLTTLSPDALTPLFGVDSPYTSQDVRSDDIDFLGGWTQLDPALDLATGLDVVQVITGNQIGFYPAPYTTVPGVGPLKVDDASFSPEFPITIQAGARSIGSVRTYFLAPTSIDFDDEAIFYYDDPDDGRIRFVVDPTLERQLLPPLPGDTPIQDGNVTQGGNELESLSSDFVIPGVRAGDLIEMLYVPMEFSVPLSNPVVGLATETFIFSLDGSPNRTLVFANDDTTIPDTDVTLNGVVQQINNAAGVTVVELTGGNNLRFNPYHLLTIRHTGTANSIILGNETIRTLQQDSTVYDQSNRSPQWGKYTIGTVTAVNPDSLILAAGETWPASAPWPANVTDQTFRIHRRGSQRITTSQMAINEAESDLYFFDVELVSEGAGDLWNIDANLQLRAEGYKSDGYYVEAGNEELTFSMADIPGMILSRTILEDGVDDHPDNALHISGSNLLITYERSPVIDSLQNFADSEVERVVCANPLSRHLVPHYVRVDLTWVGGSREEVVLVDIENYINNLAPVEELESSDLQALLSNRGATSIENPLDLIAIVHDVDRTIWAQRSQDAIGTSRLATFIPDVINLQRNTT